METDYVVSARSSYSLEKDAISFVGDYMNGKYLGESIEGMNIVELVETVIWMRYGYHLTPEIKLPYGCEGYTDFLKKEVNVRLSAFDENPSGRDMVTVCHEAGHVVEHRKEIMNCDVAAARSGIDINTVPPFRRAEWQAYEFGRAVLIPLPFLHVFVEGSPCQEFCLLATKLSEKLGVSLTVAEMRLRTYFKFKMEGKLGKLLAYAKQKHPVTAECF